MLVLLALPPLVIALGQPFYLDLVRRIMILAIAAVSLNLILGYGGLVSFGHAAYLGIGAYAVGILGFYGVTNGWIQWAVAIGASALVALAIGAVSIRTSGIYFIMITLAFTQMLYYLGISIAEFGGDDGMRLKAKSQFAGLVDLRDPVAFYYVVLLLMLLAVFLIYKIVKSRFGMVLRAGFRVAAGRGPAVRLDAALAGDPRAAPRPVGDLFPARPRRHVLQARCLRSKA